MKRQGQGVSGYGSARDKMTGSGKHVEKSRKEKEKQKEKLRIRRGEHDE